MKQWGSISQIIVSTRSDLLTSDSKGQNSWKGTWKIRTACLLFFLAIFVTSWWLWWTFQLRTFDLAFYVQSFWLALQGESATTILPGVSLMGNHAEPLAYLIVPLFALWPSPMLLVGVQTVALATMPLMAWRICLAMGFSERKSELLAVLPLLWPATWFVGLHEFHPEAFAAPALFLALAGWKTMNRWWWFAGLVLMMACKENVALMAGWICLVLGCCEPKRFRTWCLVPALLAFVWVGIYYWWLAPLWNQGKVAYGLLYAHLASESDSLLMGVLTQPGRALTHLWTSTVEGNLVSWLFFAGLGAVVLRPRWLLIALPILLQHLLSFRSSEWTVYFHYAAPLIPVVWVAAVEVMERLPARWIRVYATGLAVMALLLQIAHGPWGKIAEAFRDAPERWVAADRMRLVLNAIPPTASVTASENLLSHLAARKTIYSASKILKGLKTLSIEPLDPPPVTDYVAIDFTDPSTFDRFSGRYHPALRGQNGVEIPSSDQLFHRYLADATWNSETLDGLGLLVRRENALKQSPDREAATRLAQVVGLNLTKLEIFVAQIEPGTIILQLNLAWQCDAPRVVFPWMKLRLSGSDEIRMLTGGSNVPWVKEGGHGQETFFWTFENLPDGQYTLTLQFLDRLGDLQRWQDTDYEGTLLSTLPIGTLEIKKGVCVIKEQ